MKLRTVLIFLAFFCVIAVIRASASEKELPDLSKHIYLAVEVPKKTAYVNEKIPLAVKLYSDWLDVENITLYQDQSRDLVVKSFGDHIVSTAMKDGVKYVVLEYRSSFFAVTPGEYSPPPVKVKLDIKMPKSKKPDQGPGLLNDNRDFYEAFLGRDDSRTVELDTAPFTVTVVPSPPAAEPQAKIEPLREDKEAMPMVAAKSEPGRLGFSNHHFYRARPFILLAILPFFIIIGAVFARRRMRYLERNPRYAALLSASKTARRNIARAGSLMKRGERDRFYETVFKTMQSYLGQRSLMPPAGVTAMIVDELAGLGVEKALRDRIEGIFSQCHLIRYARVAMNRDEMEEILKDLTSTITELNKRRFDE